MSKVTWLPDEPYQDLPLLPRRVDLETPAVMRATIGARVTLEVQLHGREKIFVNTRFLTLLTTEKRTYPPLGS